MLEGLGTDLLVIGAIAVFRHRSVSGADLLRELLGRRVQLKLPGIQLLGEVLGQPLVAIEKRAKLLHVCLSGAGLGIGGRHDRRLLRFAEVRKESATDFCKSRHVS